MLVAYPAQISSLYGLVYRPGDGRRVVSELWSRMTNEKGSGNVQNEQSQLRQPRQLQCLSTLP